jgi:hypothetical protein
MNHICHDEEIDRLRQSISCAAILEREGWLLDQAGSTRHAAKYRRGTGEILIVSHEEKGWWNPLGDEKGDCFDLVQFLHPDLNFGHARKYLREISGITATFRPTQHTGPSGRDGDAGCDAPVPAPAARWASRFALTPSTAGWKYLADVRCLPETILFAASAQDCVRAGSYGSAWFAHRDHKLCLTGIEARSGDFRGMLRGSEKTLFRYDGRVGAERARVCRVAVTEAPIDALSLAASERARQNTIYVATTGGIGPGTAQALNALLADLAKTGGALVIATDADKAGDHHGDRIAALAEKLPIATERLRPQGGLKDWNDVLTSGRRRS